MYSANTPPAPVKVRAEVNPSTSSVPETLRFVLVALVVVPLETERLVIVEVGLFTRIPPVKVRRVEVAAKGKG